MATARSKTQETDAFAKADAWMKESGDKLRNTATKVTEDANSVGSVALDGEIAASTRMFKLMGDMMNARTAATLSLLNAKSVQDAFETEQTFAKTAMDAMTTGLREIGEIRFNTVKTATDTMSARTKEYMGDLAKA